MPHSQQQPISLVTLPGQPNRQTRYVRYQLASIFGVGGRTKAFALAVYRPLMYLVAFHRSIKQTPSFSQHLSGGVLYALDRARCLIEKINQ